VVALKRHESCRIPYTGKLNVVPPLAHHSTNIDFEATYKSTSFQNSEDPHIYEAQVSHTLMILEPPISSHLITSQVNEVLSIQTVWLIKKLDLFFWR